MAELLHHVIIVLNDDGVVPGLNINVYDFIPTIQDSHDVLVCRDCGLELAILVLYRRAEHYDALIPNSKSIPYCRWVEASPILSKIDITLNGYRQA